MKSKNYIPSLKELHSDEPTTTEIKSDLTMLLNSEPKKEWLQEHPDYPGHMYIPIDKLEIMLFRLFGTVDEEVLAATITPQGVHVTLRVHYVCPETNEKRFKDGVAGWPCTKKGDLKAAMQIAKTNAKKDAVDQFGKVFGRDLNRNTIKMQFEVKDKWVELQEMYEARKESIADEDHAHIRRIINNKEETSYNKTKNNLLKIKTNDEDKNN